LAEALDRTEPLATEAAAGLRAELPGLTDALRAETFKVVRRRMTYILLTVLVGLIVLFYIILWLRIKFGPEPGPQGLAEWVALRSAMSFANVVPYGLALERFFVTLMAVIFAGTMVGNEFDWRTVGVVTARGVRRWHFLLAKVLTALAFTAIAVVLGFLAALACSAWFTHLYDLPWGTFSVERILDMGVSMLRTAYVVCPFVFIAILFATVWRSAGQAVGAGLGMYFIEGIFTGLLSNVSGFLGRIPEALLNVNGDAVLRANGVVDRGGSGGPFFIPPDGPDPWRGGLVLLAWMALFLGLAFWRFNRRDIQE
jgi:ABC-type transport system involved in multi-copper enzyme maturation permease subunit